MGFDRVIQDSDDEDEYDAPPPIDQLANPPEQHQESNSSNGIQAVDKNIQIVPDNQSSETHDEPQVGVNFDYFLQSQEAAQARLSSSQQRREERWIPAEAGGGSIGSMMTDVGLAQNRPFDDTEGLVHPTGTLSESMQYDPASAQLHISHETSGSGVNGFSYGVNYADNRYQQAEMAEMPSPAYGNTFRKGQLIQGNSFLPGNPNGDFYGHTLLQTESRASISNYDYTQSVTTYNTFGQSLNPSENGETANVNSMYSTDTVPTEIVHKTPHRSKSLQTTAYSPHDTEPISSLASPHVSVSRSRSDNAGQNLPFSSSAQDELAAPVITEIPPAKKKRGRPKKQALPETDDDDELAQPVEQRGKATIQVQPSNHTGILENGQSNNDDSIHQQTDYVVVPGAGSNTDNHAFAVAIDGGQNLPVENDQPQVMGNVDIPQEHVSKEEVQNTESTKPPAKEPKKKKIKRGKTTSVTVKKTFEADLEDDVIWVAERPSKPTIEVENLAPLPKDPVATEAQVQPEPAPPAPKKRGRKRKKTAEPPVEEPPAKPEDIHIQDEKSRAPPSDGNKDISVVLKNTSNYTKTNNPSTNNEPTQDDTPTTPELIQDKQNPPTANTDSLSEQQSEAAKPPETPQKQDPNSSISTPAQPSTGKGPTKHSPISSTGKVPYRVGLSRRARIAPLLKIVKR